MSFRSKTILGIALIESVLLLVLVASGLNYLSESNTLQFQQRADSTVSLFTVSTRDAVLATDLATLEIAVAEILQVPDVVYARISSNGVVLAENGDPVLLESSRATDLSYDAVTDEVFDVKREIKVDERSYGNVELGFSTHYVDELLFSATWSAISLAGAEIVLVAIFSFILGTFLTRQLLLLRDAAESISDRGPGQQIEVLSGDEIGEVARSFNTMSLNLQQLQSETDANLAAYREQLSKSSYNEAISNGIMSSSLDAIICIDANGHVFECNEPSFEIFGWQRNEMLGRDISETIIPEKYRAAHKAGMKKFLATGEGPVLGQRLELEAVNRQGKVFPIEISISPIDSGKETMFAAYIRDLSVTKALEAEQKLAQKRAELASEAKGRFLATMSHEIRSPLNAIIAMNALLLETELNDKQREIARYVNDGSEILFLLLNDILDFSKIESGQLSLHENWFDLRACVQRTINLYAHQASAKGLELTASFAPELQAEYFGDQTRVLQVLINLLSNAIKFTEEGRVSVLLQPRQVDAGVTISVSDTGIGISDEQREHIFAEFAQVDSEDSRKFGGTGLGLSIAKGLVDLMDGSISVSSNSARGACFVVELPLAGQDGNGEPVAVESTTTEGLTFPGFRVLLAEDSATNRKVIEASLERLELDVESAVNGVEAVEMAAQKYYDLILMDIAMPKMSGLEATRKIRSGEGKSRSSRIIAITANAFEEDRENCIAAGMDDFISKPINIAHFRELASRWLVASRSEQPPEVKTTLIDLEVFEQLFKDTGEKVLPDIFKLFRKECEDRLGTMEDAYNSSDWQVIMDQAHALKSSSGSFGAIKLQAFAREMEEAAKTGNQALMDDLFGRLEQVLDHSLTSLSSLIEKKESE